MIVTHEYRSVYGDRMSALLLLQLLAPAAQLAGGRDPARLHESGHQRPEAYARGWLIQAGLLGISRRAPAGCRAIRAQTARTARIGGQIHKRSGWDRDAVGRGGRPPADGFAVAAQSARVDRS